MSKKEAISHFQSRLATRLQSAGKDGDGGTANWLAVEIAGAGFVLPLSQSGEIFPWCDPQSIPYAKEWFLGVANLRGALCGVVSLSKYFKLEPHAQTPSEAAKTVLQDRRLVGFHPSLELNTVVVVDKLIGLKSRDHMQPTGVENFYQDDQGTQWREVDLQLLSKNPTFISIAE
jgi:twitching motility protein PilI